MSARRIRGVVFDLDGTLYELAGRRLLLTVTLIKDLGLLRHMSGVRRWLRGREFSGREEFMDAFHRELSRRTGLSEERVASWYQRRFLEGFVRLLARRARTRPGVVELLERLRGAGVRLAVVSDYGKVAERLEAIGVPPDLFDALHAAEDFGALKPSPRPLTELAARWGLAPDELMMVGDRRDLDAPCAEEIGGEFLELGDWPAAVRRLERRTGVSERLN